MIAVQKSVFGKKNVWNIHLPKQCRLLCMTKLVDLYFKRILSCIIALPSVLHLCINVHTFCACIEFGCKWLRTIVFQRFMCKCGDIWKSTPGDSGNFNGRSCPLLPGIIYINCL